ncbi:hypothetical protein Trydic_g3728 [Trypoxylus dichotomus]
MSQSNGKKNNSSGSSAVNTPVSTPVTSVASVSNGQSATQTSPPPNNNAPKYGTLVPNRIFVGGISANTTEDELMQLFNNYGKVKAAKIIQDRAGVSKGYGFITFESEDDAKRLQREAEDIVLKERKLNIAPAIKKQPFNRTFDGSSPPAVAAGNPAQFYFQPGTIPYFQGGVAYYPPPTATSGDPNTQQPPMYQAPSVYPAQSGPPQTATYPPVIFPAQPMYMPQQYPMPMPYEYNYYPNGAPQYMVGGQGGPQSQVPPLQRPGSPPRQPCYGQQLQYNPEMYYNVPMYGTMEGPALYQDSLDMANGTITEDSTYPPMDNGVQQDLEQQPIGVADLINDQHHETVNHQRSVTQQQQPDTTRQSNTPVVSLLSLDQHQEKDYNSMQGGRRRKLNNTPPTSNNNNNVAHNFNGYVPPFPPTGAPYYGNVLPPPPNPTGNIYGYHSANHFNAFYSNPNPAAYGKYHQGGGVGGANSKVGGVNMNGQLEHRNTWTRRRKVEKRNTMETGSMSSLRTDSNSSASVVDDPTNRNDDKSAITGVDTPPPAPYSPMTATMHYPYLPNNNNSNKMGNPTVRHFSNRSLRGGSLAHHHHNATNRMSNATAPPPPRNPNGKTRSVPLAAPEPSVNILLGPNSSSNAGSNKASVSQFSSQVHAGATPPQHFAPPMRRGRRSMRRSVQAINEIGAGDAPLPNTDVSDACKKLDSLKL